MIRYSLACVGEHEFEAWFSNSKTYDTQRKKKLVECPVCGSTDVKKQIMAPMVRSSDRAVPTEVAAAKIAAEIRQHISSTHDYVGEKFADEARAMYYGETEHRPVWGEVTPEVAKDLIDEGVPAMPLPKPFAPDPPRRKARLN
ncbi:MAG: DUF1178 family protein [Hyphomonadaceae bacterium]|nr:DUF1178 family protein [Hyphomonadaceae bacterium]MBP9235764.1 DUF1178 family protein [Hyphomonadaceae bacterium]